MNDLIYFYYPKYLNYVLVSPSKEVSTFPRNGLESWIIQTFYILEENSPDLNIQLVDYVPNSGIIVFHSGHFDKNLKPSKRQFFICIPADYGRHRYAQIHLYQNQIQLELSFKNIRILIDSYFSFTGNWFLPFWPQPKIIKRNDERSKLRKIGYFGLRKNLDESIISKLHNFCIENDLVFEIVEDYSKWNNYWEFDLMLSIRDFERKQHHNKPFSKILNAIIAGVPVISGYESSAFFFKKYYYKNLPIVDSQEKLFALILDMKKNYSYYLSQIIGIQERIDQEFNVELQAKWIKFLKKSQLAYSIWTKSSFATRNSFYFSRQIQFLKKGK